jgi:large subunit ribosomal protein L30e
MNLADALKKGKVIVGTDSTLKALKNSKAKEVFLSKNCPEDLKKQIKRYCEISGAKLNELDQTNEELGSACKKPFSINACYY